MLFLKLPFPPSINTYWGFQGHRRFLTARAKAFKDLVRNEFNSANHQGFGDAPVQLEIVWHEPDKRRRDIDNPLKPLLDALCQAGVFVDDSQVRRLAVEFREPIKYGLAEVRIQLLQTLPPL